MYLVVDIRYNKRRYYSALIYLEMKMKIACTGLEPGRVAKELINRGVEFISADVTDVDAFYGAIKLSNPDIIIHTAAMTGVEQCEDAPLQAKRINVDGVNNLIDWYKGKVIFISSDHIFSGTKWFGSGYSERHNPSPVNVYGMTKIAGEFIAVNGVSDARIIRTSKLFDYADLKDTIYNLQNGEEQEFTDLLRRSFLYVNHFVDGLLYAVKMFNYLPEIVNLSGIGIYSYAGFWVMICKEFGLDDSLIKFRRTELVNASPRPLRGGLNVSLARDLGFPLYSAIDGIREVKKMYE
jgi:dTDP-4-dehydrorhamnose reductase